MVFDIDKTVQYWKEGAAYDLETGKSLLESRRFPYALFFGHLALEKILKPLLVKTTKDHAPFTHSLTFLASGAPRAKARGSSTCFVGRNPPKHTLLRSFGASKGSLHAFIHGLKTCGFLRRRVKLKLRFLNRSLINLQNTRSFISNQDIQTKKGISIEDAPKSLLVKNLLRLRRSING